MPNIDLSILNQRQTPAFYADVFANRPAAGFVGRIFVSTDTYAFYRDNGTGWDLIGGPGTGTVTGSGAAGQVAFWSGSSLISGENNLWWDSTNNHFGINTNTPGTALDVHHDQSTVGILNQTVATNDTRIAFQNSGVAKWRVGNFYNLGSNDYAVNDATLNINRFTVKSSSGQTFVGDETTSSGLFVVNNSSGDAHIVALGATAPSIRVRNAGVGASLQFGLGLATTTNNFIQGATGGEFCIFNDSLTAQPILFGIKDAGLGNTQEAARISAARNFLIGTTTDAGQKLQVSGTSKLQASGTTYSSGSLILTSSSGTNPIYLTSNGGFFALSNGGGADHLLIASTGAATFSSSGSFGTTLGIAGGVPSGSNVLAANGSAIFTGGLTAGTNITLGSGFNLTWGGNYGANIPTLIGLSGASGYITFYPSGSTNGEAARFTNSNNFLIGTTTDNGNKLQVIGTAFSNKSIINSENSGLIVDVNAANRHGFMKYTNYGTGLVGKDSGTDGSISTWLGRWSGTDINSPTSIAQDLSITTNGNVLIGTPNNGSSKLRIVGLPTSAAGLSSGDIWNNGGVLNIV